jgi:hypothetical protein
VPGSARSSETLSRRKRKDSHDIGVPYCDYSTERLSKPARLDVFELPEPGLYRTTEPCPGHEDTFPADVLVYVGPSTNGGGTFIVRPGANRRNRWFWGEPTTTLRSPSWGKSLRKLPAEGFYTLPETVDLESGGRWLKNAIVQLGYNEKGQAILFVAEWNEEGTDNVLRFGDRGLIISDSLLDRLIWAPILPIHDKNEGPA